VEESAKWRNKCQEPIADCSALAEKKSFLMIFEHKNHIYETALKNLEFPHLKRYTVRNFL